MIHEADTRFHFSLEQNMHETIDGWCFLFTTVTSIKLIYVCDVRELNQNQIWLHLASVCILITAVKNKLQEVNKIQVGYFLRTKCEAC